MAARFGIVREDVAPNCCRDEFDLGDSGKIAELRGHNGWDPLDMTWMEPGARVIDFIVTRKC